MASFPWSWLRALSFLGIWAIVLAFVRVAAGAPQEGPDIEVFTRGGCPHCAAAADFLSDLQREDPALRIVKRRVDRDPRAREDLFARAKSAGLSSPGVPLFVIRGTVLVGFDSPETTGRRIRELLAKGEPAPETKGVCPPDSVSDCPSGTAPEEVHTMFGGLSVAEMGLPLFTIALGLLDGFNPCAMWVLLFLLSMLAGLNDRRKMALVAGVFVLTSALVYFAFMAAWLNVFVFLGLSRAVEVSLGFVALAVAAINIKDFFAFKRGISLTIPERAKRGLYARVRSVVRAETIGAALAAVSVLAVLVNFIELLCTAGFPAVYTAILTKHALSAWQHYGYLLLYNLAYMLDDGLMVSIAVVTLGHRKLTERGGRWLKLVSGTVMLVLALSLLFWPQLLYGSGDLVHGGAGMRSGS